MTPVGTVPSSDQLPPAGAGGGLIFISHVEEDAPIALRLAEALEAAGYSTWCYERDAVPGPSYLLQTARHVEESAAVVLLISPNSLGSRQVTAEVVRAHESGRPFIPLLIGISHVEFGARQPEWREALGSATSIAVPRGDVTAVVPRVCRGLEGLGIAPAASRTGLESAYATPTRPATLPTPSPHRNRTPLLVAVGAGVAIVALVAIGVIALGGRQTQGARQTSTSVSTTAGPTSTVTTQANPAPTTAPAPAPTVPAPGPSVTVGPATTKPAPAPTNPPAPTSPPPTPTTSPPATTAPTYASADNTPLRTAAGSMDVFDATLNEQWCSPQDGQCLTAPANERYLVMELTRTDLEPVTMPESLVDEANRSTVSFGGGQAGPAKVALDTDADMIDVVYGPVPSTASDADVLLHWPNNPTLRLTVF